ncbi:MULTISPECIES: lysophospholipid acyltransferase family protein [Clostridium]|uniref:lysophospholipid acyltransferase family protein n=1 Tax=Clostridium TaxID=1485 RepID=UPI00082686F7|nr:MULTISPECIES: lysophospholipid acyltransferase family protein [Clostridium]PJI07353.1 1-acyl-sn-glycerol-3-phosphate acyltransferase [Clostridium sp. CT7]
MRWIFLYIYFVFYMIKTLFFKIKLNHIKKIKSEKEYEEAVHNVVFKWSKHILKVIGIKVNVKGLENIPEGTCVFISNHQSNLDFLAIMGIIDKQIGFIAKREILKIKIVSGWMKMMHCVFIDRNDIRKSLMAINEGVENLDKGYSMAIFPEGTRSKSSNMGEFKKGSLKLATKANAVVVPIAIDGAYKLFEDVGGKIRSGVINMSILEPIDIKELDRSEKSKLSDILHDKIYKEVQKIKS